MKGGWLNILLYIWSINYTCIKYLIRYCFGWSTIYAGGTFELLESNAGITELIDTEQYSWSDFFFLKKSARCTKFGLCAGSEEGFDHKDLSYAASPYISVNSCFQDLNQWPPVSKAWSRTYNWTTTRGEDWMIGNQTFHISEVQHC